MNMPVMTATYAALVIFTAVIILAISAVIWFLVLTYDWINAKRYNRMKYAYEKLKEDYDRDRRS